MSSLSIRALSDTSQLSWHGVNVAEASSALDFYKIFNAYSQELICLLSTYWSDPNLGPYVKHIYERIFGSTLQRFNLNEFTGHEQLFSFVEKHGLPPAAKEIQDDFNAFFNQIILRVVRTGPGRWFDVPVNVLVKFADGSEITPFRHTVINLDWKSMPMLFSVTAKPNDSWLYVVQVDSTAPCFRDGNMHLLLTCNHGKKHMLTESGGPGVVVSTVPAKLDVLLQLSGADPPRSTGTG